MDTFKKEKIEVHKIALGMFVVELDRPWKDSPFMLQGFLLDNQNDVDKMHALCQFVYIDRTKSLGEHWTIPTKKDISAKREIPIIKIIASNKQKSSAQTSKKNLHTLEKVQKGEKVSFMDIMREIKGYKAPKNAEVNSDDGKVLNVKSEKDTHTQRAIDDVKTSSRNSKTTLSSIIENINSFVGILFKHTPSTLKTSTESTSIDKINEENDDGFSIRIYEEEAPVENEIAVIYPVYEQSQIATRDIFDAIAHEQALDLSAVSDILDNMVESIGRTPDALLWLAKLKQTDDYAYNHALNVSITLMAFANFLALSKMDIKELGLTGLLQDIGKVKLSEDILLKNGKLTKEEYEYAKKHVDETLEILKTASDMSVSVIKWVSEHHERVDGSGYPSQLKNGQISLPSQASGLIDTYCAMTTNRCYAKAAFHQEALDKIHELSGTQFSSELVDQLIQFMGIYPVSSLVELNSGEVGVVIQQNQVRRLLPRLMLLLDNEKIRLKSPSIINLLISPKTPSGEPYRIIKSLMPDSYGLNPSDLYI